MSKPKGAGRMMSFEHDHGENFDLRITQHVAVIYNSCFVEELCMSNLVKNLAMVEISRMYLHDNSFGSECESNI